MSQALIESLYSSYNFDYPVEEYNNNIFLIEEALKQTGARKEDDTLPDYYDDMLMELINAVPLE